MDCDLSRRFVQLLLDWAAAPPGAREVKRELMAPANEFWPWLCGIIEPCYHPSLDVLGGITEAEFRDHCVHKVFKWADTKPELLTQSYFTDARLAAFIRTLAHNEQISIWRRMRKLNSLDDYTDDSPASSTDEERTQHVLPEPLRVDPVDPFAAADAPRAAEFSQARAVMPFFGRSLHGKKRMRQLLALLLRLGRRIGKKKGFPAYWYVYRMLKRKRGKHLPDYLLGFLRKRLSPLNNKAINGRLACLRRAFTNFSL